MNGEPIILVDQQLPADISPDTRTLIKAITVVADLEQRLPLIDTIEEVERWRIQTATVLSFARETQKQAAGQINEWVLLAKELERWAARVGIMCQRRVGQLLKNTRLSRGGRPVTKTNAHRESVSQVPQPPPVTLESLGISAKYAATAKLLASVPEDKIKANLDQQLESNGKIQRAKLIGEVKAAAKAKGESIDDKTAASRARNRRYRDKKRSERNQEQAAKSPRVRQSPSDRFKLYWTNEKKLLYKFFEISDLEKVAEYWWREFHLYRAEEEKILSDARQERERKAGLVELTKNP